MGDAPAFTPDELRALEGDAEFQRRVASDRELDDLFNPPPDDEDEREHTARGLGMAYVIAGVTVPPPTVGTFRLLSMVGSEFLKAERKFEDLTREITLALFVLHFGHRAVAPVCGQFRWRRALEKYAKSADTSPEHLARMLAEERKIADELAAWDRALARFASTHIKPAGKSFIAIVQEIDIYLNAALAGLDELPQLEPAPDAKKKAPHGMKSARRIFSGLFGKRRPASPSTSSDGRSRS